MKRNSSIDNNIKNTNKSRVFKRDSVSGISNPIIKGYFPEKAFSPKKLAIRKVNETLCGMLIFSCFLAMFSYYVVVSQEIKLNECTSETLLLNVENSELQNKLDRLKSFNNVDLTMTKSNLLQKPEKVIEATEVNTNLPTESKVQKNTKKATNWAIGY